jgi:hypothetical protein
MNDEVSFPRKWEFIFSSLDSQLCQAELGSASRYKIPLRTKMPNQVRHDKKTCWDVESTAA